MKNRERTYIKVRKILPKKKPALLKKDRTKTEGNIVVIDFNYWCTQQQKADQWDCSVSYIAQCIRKEKIDYIVIDQIPRCILVSRNQSKS